MSYMRPTLTPYNSVALLRADAVLLGKLCMGYAALGVYFSHFYNICIGQFCMYVISTFKIGKSMFGMKYILLVRYPFQIRDMIIRWIKINMINFAIIRLSGNEVNRNKPVNKNSFLYAISAKLNPAMPIFIWDKYFAKKPATLAGNAFNVTKIGDHIHAFKTNYIFPLLFHVITLSKKIKIHTDRRL